MSSGAAENTKLTLNLLDRSRFEPFIATSPGQSMDAEVAPDVVRVPLRWLWRPINPILDVLALWELYGVMRRWRFDVVHTHNAKDGILGRWAALLARTPVIVHTIHNVSFQASPNGGPHVREVFDETAGDNDIEISPVLLLDLRREKVSINDIRGINPVLLKEPSVDVYSRLRVFNAIRLVAEHLPLLYQVSPGALPTSTTLAPSVLGRCVL